MATYTHTKVQPAAVQCSLATWAMLQAHLGHKINGNKIHDSDKTIRSNVIKIDKALRQIAC